MAEKPNNYELAYHLDPNLDENALRQNRQEIEQLIVSRAGVILFAKEPEKQHLSYPIGHEHSSFFGYIQFTLPDKEQLAGIDEQIRLHQSIMRHIVLRMEPESTKKTKPRSLTGQQQARERKLKKGETPATPNPEMEKQLEEVIGNL